MKESLGANTLVYPTPVWVIGTYNEDEEYDIPTFLRKRVD